MFTDDDFDALNTAAYSKKHYYIHHSKKWKRGRPKKDMESPSIQENEIEEESSSEFCPDKDAEK